MTHEYDRYDRRWRLYVRDNEENEIFYGRVTYEEKQTYEHITKAVNMHARLVEALKNAVEWRN